MEAEIPRLLIVDDEEAIQIALKRILLSEGYEVDCAGSGTEGIEKALAGNYDIALLDLRMPDISGIEVLGRLKKDKPNTVCYIVTAYASYESAIEATRMGADGYILKPFVPDELLQYLSVGLIKRRMLQEAEQLKKDRAERLLELAFERSRLNTVIHSLKDGVLVINTAVETVYFNPAVSLILNLPDLKIGDNTFEHLPEELKQLIRQHFNDVVVPATTYSIIVKTNPEPEKFMDCSVSPVFLNDTTLGGIVIIFKDVTELKRIEQVKSQFVSMVAHELKAPVAAVLGFLDIMKNPAIQITDEQRNDFLTRSHRRLTSLLGMVNDLLDISRIEMNSVKREIQKLKCSDVIAEVLQLFANEIESKNLSVEHNTTVQEKLIEGDREELLRLFTNLISNAIKYNTAGGLLKINYSFNENFLRISIADTGIGMKPEDLKRLFSEFYRVKNEITRNIHGTGLGLAIVKRIIDAYSGTIAVKSEYRHGTEFIVSLPGTFNKT